MAWQLIFGDMIGLEKKYRQAIFLYVQFIYNIDFLYYHTPADWRRLGETKNASRKIDEDVSMTTAPVGTSKK